MKILVILMILIMVPVAFAQTSGALDPGITPDSPLYGLDKAVDNIRASMSADKVQARLQIADERIAEYEVMLDKNKTVEANEALTGEQEEVAKAETELGKLSNKADKQLKFYAHMQHLMQVQQRIQAKHPEAAQGISNAISNTEANLAKIQADLPADQIQTEEQLETGFKQSYGTSIIDKKETSSCKSWETEEDGHCIIK